MPRLRVGRAVRRKPQSIMKLDEFMIYVDYRAQNRWILIWINASPKMENEKSFCDFEKVCFLCVASDFESFKRFDSSKLLGMIVMFPQFT